MTVAIAIACMSGIIMVSGGVLGQATNDCCHCYSLYVWNHHGEWWGIGTGNK